VSQRADPPPDAAPNPDATRALLDARRDRAERMLNGLEPAARHL